MRSPLKFHRALCLSLCCSWKKIIRERGCILTGKREIKSCSVANWWSLNWLLLKNQILGQNRKHYKKVSSRSGPGQNVKLDISSCLWKWGQQKNHYPAVRLHPGLWMWQWERRQQLTTRTPTPSQPQDILQKCHLSSATDTWKQLMTCGRAITRVKILAFLIHPDEWRSILIREKTILRSKQANNDTEVLQRDLDKSEMGNQ